LSEPGDWSFLKSQNIRQLDCKISAQDNKGYPNGWPFSHGSHVSPGMKRRLNSSRIVRACLGFLGKSVSIPKGPAMISLKSGAPIVPTFSIRQIDNTYKTIYLPPIYPVKTGNKEQDFLSLTKKCVSVIEDKIREYPEQWFMFREFWAEDANKVDIV